MELDCNLMFFRSSQMQTELKTGHEKIQDLEEPKGMSDDIVDSARLEDEGQQLRKGLSSVEKKGKTEPEQANNQFRLALSLQKKEASYSVEDALLFIIPRLSSQSHEETQLFKPCFNLFQLIYYKFEPFKS